jgi:hypothetical protein
LNFAVAERDLDALFLLEDPQTYAAGIHSSAAGFRPICCTPAGTRTEFQTPNQSSVDVPNTPNNTPAQIGWLRYQPVPNQPTNF